MGIKTNSKSNDTNVINGNGQETKESLSQKPKRQLTLVPEEPKYTFDDLILPSHVRNQIYDIADYKKNSDLVFNTWGFNKTHKQAKRLSVNFYGPPGTGKTMAAHALAHHLNKQILIVNYADIESKYVGDTPKNIQQAFEIAKDTNSILFFDEADAILSKRVTNMSSATDVSVNQTRSVLLMLLNDFEDFVIFATNFIENFDAAFMRRIAMHVEFQLPDLDNRKKLLERYTPNNFPITYDIDEMAELAEGLSASDISTVMLNTAFKAARQHDSQVPASLLKESIESVLKSKEANKNGDSKKPTTTKTVVSEEYVKQQLGKEKV